MGCLDQATHSEAPSVVRPQQGGGEPFRVKTTGYAFLTPPLTSQGVLKSSPATHPSGFPAPLEEARQRHQPEGQTQDSCLAMRPGARHGLSGSLSFPYTQRGVIEPSTNWAMPGPSVGQCQALTWESFVSPPAAGTPNQAPTHSCPLWLSWLYLGPIIQMVKATHQGGAGSPHPSTLKTLSAPAVPTPLPPTHEETQSPQP